MEREKEIIKAVANRDQNAFKALYESFSNMVYNTALAYVKNSHDAEEITQETFIKIFRYAAKFKGDSSLSTWIYRITINTSLNYIKQKKRKTTLVFNSSDFDKIDFEHPGVILANKEKASLLLSVIDTLADNQKTAFILSYIEELPRKKVAEIMELSLKAVESLLQRAKSNLRDKLINLYPERRKK